MEDPCGRHGSVHGGSCQYVRLVLRRPFINTDFSLQVGYDTAVIGGTMALDSFIQDFRLDEVSTTVRDTMQGNIVSTFQASTPPDFQRVSSKNSSVILISLTGGLLLWCSLHFSYR